MSVSSRAEGEASKKGLTGAAKRQYVGGAINRARHEKAEEKAAHREAIADARSQIRYHEAQVAGLREGMKQRRELAGAGKPKPSEHPRATARAVEAQTTLDDLRRHKAGYPGDYYGDEMLLAYEVHRAEQSASGKRGGITSALPASQLRRIQQQIAQTREPPGTPRAASATRPPAQPKPATPKRAPRPKKPPTLERQIAQAGGYVPKTPAAKLRKTPVREMTDEQLLRDWENHPPERRRGVLEREMARRQAKAAKAQQPKPAKTKRGEFSIPTPIRTDFPYEKSDPYKTPDMDHLADAYGRPQLRAAMANYSVETLRQIAGSYHERHPNAPMARGRSREQLLDGLLRQYDAAQRRRS